MGYRFNAPPNWPPPPTPGWAPPAGWRPDLSWGPAPDGWVFWVENGEAVGVGPRGPAPAPPPSADASRAKKAHPVMTIVLLTVAVLFSVGVGLGLTDEAAILEDPPASASSGMVAIWISATLVLVAILLAARRPRTRAVRVLILALVVPLLGVAVLSTVRLNDLSSSGFIRDAQLAKSQADAEATALKERLAIAAAAVCRGTPAAGAPSVSDPPRLVVVDEQGTLFGWDAVQDRGWAPDAVADVQLVVCLEPETQSVETCRYTGGVSYDITVFQRIVHLLNATDGTALAIADPLFGAASDCDEVITGGHVPVGVTGDHVDGEKVLEYVAGVLANS